MSYRNKRCILTGVFETEIRNRCKKWKRKKTPGRVQVAVEQRLLVQFKNVCSLDKSFYHMHNKPPKQLTDPITALSTSIFHTLHCRLLPTMGIQPICIVGQLWPHEGISGWVIVTPRSSLMHGHHEGGEWDRVPFKCSWHHHVTSEHATSPELKRSRSHELIHPPVI